MSGVKKRAKSKTIRKAEGAAVPIRGVPTPAEFALTTFFKNRTVLLCLSLVIFTSVLYVPAISHPFADYDDDVYVTTNAGVQSGLTWKSFIWAITATEKSNWHPLTWMSHQVDFQLYGMSPAGHHATSVVLHVINVVLLFLALSLATRAPVQSFIVAVLFAIHPLDVESVVWIAERKNVLSTAFFFAAIGLYVFYARKPSVGRYLLLTSAFVLGLASKPMVITLPCVLLLLDYWPLQRAQEQSQPSSGFRVPQLPWSQLWLEKIPLFVLCALSAWVTLYAQSAGGAIKSLESHSLGIRLRTAVWAYGEYLYKTLWPSSLAPLYPDMGNTLAAWRIGLALLLIGSISIFAWRRRSASPYLLVGWCWFVGTLVPVIGLVQVGNQAIADRYTYLPVVGLLIALVWLATDLLPHVRHGTTAAAGLVVVLALALSWRTHQQIGFWRSSVDLWSHTLEVTTNNAVAENNLGVALMGLGRESEGVAHFQNAERIDPKDPTSRLNLAVVLESHGKFDESLREFERVIELASGSAAASANSKLIVTAYTDIGTIYGQVGDYPKSREAYRAALAMNPVALNDTITKFSSFVSAKPSANRFTLLGVMLELTGRVQEAQAAYRRALQLNPNQAEALRSLNASRD
jgi:protein O-mannosyl-transferase